MGRAAQSFFVRFANDRVPTSLGRPIATTERIRSVAGEIEAQLVQAEEVLLSLAARVDAGIRGPPSASSSASCSPPARRSRRSRPPSPPSATPDSRGTTRSSATCATSSPRGCTRRRTTPPS
ncbi:hypothetical protein Q0F99_16170 [Rathayibacter oskolensis]|nr:hypothetical protein [Rathayibacter oskolensis]WKK71111.1 hypothetical protein Q0F99_16170 [Rathayibacter oskolensis]